MVLVSCSVCENELNNDALFCPRCLTDRVSASEEWFPIDDNVSANPVTNHELVPEHRVYPEQKTTELLREYGITRTDLPLIKESDPAVEHLECTPGDVLQIIRESRTAGEAVTYRLVVSSSGTMGESSVEEWRSPGEPSPEVYEFTEDISEDQALQILQNVRAHIPPSEPGACRRIAVDRETELEAAITRLQDNHPYTFIQGELGYGKSFFLHWIRDNAFSWSAVSIIDLGEDTTFTAPAVLMEEFRDALETPRSIENTEYANGLDELWDTFLRQVSDLCASYYEREGYELRKSRVAESVRLATDDLLSTTGINAEVRSQLADAAADHFDSSHQSISQSLFEEISDKSAFDHLELMATLARLNGLRLLLGVDELEKAERTPDHFAAIVEFIEQLPSNVSLFVTGTPELVEGGEEGDTFYETHQGLYEKTIDNRIVLESPTKQDLEEFTRRMLSLEEIALDGPDREYTASVESIGGIDSAVDQFLAERSPTFRGYLEFLETR